MKQIKTKRFVGEICLEDLKGGIKQWFNVSWAIIPTLVVLLELGDKKAGIGQDSRVRIRLKQLW